jgi:hypothetical protein
MTTDIEITDAMADAALRALYPKMMAQWSHPHLALQRGCIKDAIRAALEEKEPSHGPDR